MGADPDGETHRQLKQYDPDADIRSIIDVKAFDIHRVYHHWEKRFGPSAESQWAHLSRFNNLLIILNISLFFLTDLVTRYGYYYTFYSLMFLGLTAIGALLPFGLLHRLWYYLIFLFSEAVGGYFLVASIWYWIGTYSGSPG